MAKTQTLKATERARTGSGLLKKMRREGFVPSVIYGGGIENRNVKVDAKELRDMLNDAASDSILVNLDIEGVGSQLAFLQDVQHNALTGAIVHVDFLAVNNDTQITANLPLELIGDAIGASRGGFLDQMLHSLEVTCLPKDLPESIKVPVEHLDVGDVLHVGDVTFPEGVTPVLADDVVLALVVKTRTAKSASGTATEEAAPAAE